MTDERQQRGGWSEIEALRGKGAEARKQERPEAEGQVAAAMRRLFATEDGRVVLEWLKDQTIRRETWHPLGLDPRISRETRVDYGHFREGQNSICRTILNIIEEEDHD